ncbi:UNVERIFIED_CONTAM: hypothetical protein NCL1_35872 [Trichonephila clavipes]
MIAALLIAVVLIQGNGVKATGDNCGDDRIAKCEKLYRTEEINKLGPFPSEKGLDRTCPDILKLAQCFEDFYNDCKDKKGEMFGVYTFDVKFMREFCNKQSSIRYHYLKIAKCFDKVEMRLNECRDKGPKAYEHYVESTGYEDKTEFKYHQSCLQSAYGLACSVSEIEASCGYTAYKAFFEMEKMRDSFAFTKYFCNRIDFEEEIKNGFFTTLRIPESQRHS